MGFLGKLSILIISPSYYPHIGGVEYVVKSVAERLTKKGHNVYVLCGEQGIDKPMEEDIEGIPVTRWPVQSPGNAYHIPLRRSELSEWLIKRVRGYDVVHLHSVHSVFTMYSLDVLKNARIRKVLTPHYHGTGHTFFRRVLWEVWRLYVKRLLLYVDVIHSVSKYEAGLLAKDFGINPVVIEHGVEEWIQSISWNPSDYVMYSGRIEKYKNIHRLANIVKILNSMGFDLKLKIFGEGTYKNELVKHLDKLGLDYEINPPQPYEKYIEYLSKAKFLGLLSEKEAYGQVVNEANAIGVPVVIAKPWGQNFAYRDRTLIIDLSKNDIEIAKEVAKFLNEIQGQPKSFILDWDQVVDLYIKLLYSKHNLEIKNYVELAYKIT